jgi:prolyl-tRNA synthetase
LKFGLNEEKQSDLGITVKKNENFSEWYVQIVRKAELADYAKVKGFTVVMPYGYSIWEKIRDYLDSKFKETGHKNAYFPSLIPESLLGKEAEHFSGFTPEVFWVTHAGNSELGERLATRPTSETIAYDSYSKWIKSWRDLPLLLNFWNSVLRAEITGTKPFIRTSEFLWQEGHTVHATQEETDEEVMRMLNVYREFVENVLAVPAMTGKKSESEKFVGALYTMTLEGLMPDGRALQMGTSHNLGQNFSKSFEIKFIGKDEKEHFAWQASWGVSWRLIGALVMVHGDDKGLILPPKIAPIEAVIIPIFYSDSDKEVVLQKIDEVSQLLCNKGMSIYADTREQYTPGWKFNEWELKGVPLRIEIGPRDIKNKKITIVRRDTFEKLEVEEKLIYQEIKRISEDIQRNLFKKAKDFMESHTTEVDNYRDFKKVLDEKGGFLKVFWCSRQECEEKIKDETGATIRLLSEKEEVTSNCIYCGEKALTEALFAKAY